MKPFKPPTPVATNILIGLCVAVQLGVMVGGDGFAETVIFGFGLIPARISAALAGQVGLAGAAGSLVTHMFVHGGWLHLLLNMVFLAWVGRYVEWVVGRGMLYVLFLVGGLAGAALQVASDPGSFTPVVGASGAIAAVFGAYAVLFARNRAETRRVLGISISGETLTALWYAATWIALQLLIGFVFSSPGGLQVAIWTHIGGFIAGLLMARPWSAGPEID